MSSIVLQINGKPVAVPAGSSVAAALRSADVAGLGVTRRSVLGEARAPFCGMGICQECRVSIDGARRLACQTACVAGMKVETGT
ncbi:(2Fe-2S)-binding protein [Variovorax robiniae]|uniref:(2Fe-2S)-binding protein n=1 Tax=Variovorax robiniae TaxID=1836199 RepID=A0ABU8X576_9BURK